jgi:(E)-4-hydroxy-3-methylbut-2-enyl-diphosphate synthase
VVNGPGEAREADLGIAAGKGLGHLIVKGEVKGKVPEDRFVEVLVGEAGKMAADTTASDAKRRPSCILMIQRLGSGSRAT